MLRNKSVKGNAILNIIRQLCNTILPLVTFAYATRVLQVENYGRINFCSYNVSYFTLIAGLGISTYAVREAPAIRDNPNKIKKFISQLFTINILATIVSYILLSIALVIWHPTEEYYYLVIIYAFSIIFTTIGVDWFFHIYEEYLYITVRTIIIHIVQIVLVFILVKGPDDTNIYAMIMVGTVGALQILNFIVARKRTRFGFTSKLDIKIHLRPILLLFANSVLIVIYLNSDITMLGFIRGDSDVGIYKAAVNIYQAVKSLLNAIYVVTIPRLSYYLSHDQKDNYNKLANQVLDTLITLIFPALVGLFFVSRNVILLISGETYLEAVQPLQILSISLIFASIGGFFVNGILIVNKNEKRVLQATIISALANICLNIILIPRIGATGAAFTTMIAELIVAIMAYTNAKNFVVFSITKRTLISVFIGCVGIAFICWISNRVFSSVFLATFISVLGSITFYFVVQLMIRPYFVKKLIRRN